jgi:hypothetical protein
LVNDDFISSRKFEVESIVVSAKGELKITFTDNFILPLSWERSRRLKDLTKNEEAQSLLKQIISISLKLSLNSLVLYDPESIPTLLVDYTLV